MPELCILVDNEYWSVLGFGNVYKIRKKQKMKTFIAPLASPLTLCRKAVSVWYWVHVWVDLIPDASISIGSTLVRILANILQCLRQREFMHLYFAGHTNINNVTSWEKISCSPLALKMMQIAFNSSFEPVYLWMIFCFVVVTACSCLPHSAF